MSILDIKKYPDPILRQVAEKVEFVDQNVRTLLDNMADTMYAARGIGLAASQVGVLQRIVVIDISEARNERMDLVNPHIVWSDGKTSSEEGCLSIPEYRDTVKRSERVTVQALNEHGKEVEFSAEGLLAICIQHEIDHLDGVLFIDRLSRLKREMFKRAFKKRISDIG